MKVGTKLHYVHVASNSHLTHYSGHPRRGTWAMDEAGILPRFSGTMIHDCWSAYWQYSRARHAVCNAHILRELKFFIEAEADQRAWAEQMEVLLLEAKAEVEQVKSERRQSKKTS